MLESRLNGSGGDLPAAVEDLRAILADSGFAFRLPDVDRLSRSIAGSYASLYEAKHGERARAFSQAVDEVKGTAGWPAVTEEMQISVLAPLTARVCVTEDELEALPPVLADGAALCPRCGATIAQMESDLAALDGLKTQVLARVQELAVPPDRVDRIRRVKLAGFFPEAIDGTEAIKRALEDIEEHLLKLLDEGAEIIVE